MTATVQLNERRDPLLWWALALSILAHAVLLMPGIRDMFSALDLEVEDEPVAIPMEFTLVSPPENPTPTDRISKYLSTVTSGARDVVETNQRTEEPHSEGRIPIPDNPSPAEGAEGGGTNDVPPLPEPVTDLGEAFEKSRFIEQSSPQRERSMPEENPDFDNEGSARASIGGIQLSTTAWDFAPYLLDLKHRIKQHWIPPLAFTALGAIHGYTWVRFRIYPDGSLEALEVVETEGHDSLHRSSVNAIKGAAPFRQLPRDFPDPYLEITFGFYYLLPGDEQRFFKDRQERSAP